MVFRLLKSTVPRGLYWRAALILVLPVVALQLVVSVVFIQRHFQGVTAQMSTVFAREVTLVLQAGPARDSVAAPLQIAVQPFSADVPPDRQRWFDLTGGHVIRSLHLRVPGLRAVVLPDTRVALIYVDTPEGMLELRVERWRLSASNPHQLFVNMLVFGLLMTVIAFIYLRNQLRPITRLANAAEAFGRGRIVPYRPSGAVEVRAAGHAFLDMRARIERQIEQRTMMLSGVSHDLRTPLTRLRLGLSLLDDIDRAPMERDLDEMQQMLDAFLAFAKGATEGEPEMTDPRALVAELVADHQRAGKLVEMTAGEGQGRVPLRPAAIRRALDNLITNAVRYGSRAEVSVVLTDKSLRFRVEDDGPGIPPELRGEAIKPFNRLDAARNQNAGPGVGLGLAIAADVARAHGGVLRLGESETLGGLRADLVIAR